MGEEAKGISLEARALAEEANAIDGEGKAIDREKKEFRPEADSLREQQNLRRHPAKRISKQAEAHAALAEARRLVERAAEGEGACYGSDKIEETLLAVLKAEDVFKVSLR